MEAITFDDLQQLDSIQNNKPFFSIDLSNDDTVLNWLKNELVRLRSNSVTRLEKAQNNYLRYKGLQYFNAVYYPRDVLEVQKKYTPQLVMPLISDFIDEKVARIMELKPSVTVLPVHDERQDKVDAKVAKKFLQHVDKAQNLDHKLQKVLRNSQVTGESFLWTRWNPDLGERVAEIDDIKKTEDGQPVSQALFQGDVEVLNKTINYVFYEQAESWDKVNYCFIIELDYVEAMKLDYPQVADKISEDVEAKIFDFDTMEQVDVRGKCRKIYFYHKRTKYLPDGFEAVFTLNTLLKKAPLDKCYEGLPIDRLVAVENDEEIHGQSSIDKVRGIASNVNNMLNSMIKMFMLAGYAKWFVDAGSVDDQQLSNDVNIVKVKPGSRAPELVQANPVGGSHFDFVDKFINWFYKFSKSNSVVRGEPPPGVTAGVALQYVSESESRRLTTDVANFNEIVRSVNDKILTVCGHKYRKDDKRTMLLLGKDNRWENIPLDLSTISKDYSVQIQGTTGLSDSKAVRIQQVIDLETARPGILPQEQFIEMTGLAQADKAYDIASSAARAAEDENEQMQDNGQLIEPEVYEDHIVHWKIHVQSIQPSGFKQKASPEIQKCMQDHILTHEMMMMDAAQDNPLYLQALSTLQGFPMFAVMPSIVPPVAPLPPDIPIEPPSEGVVQGDELARQEMIQ